MIVYICPYCNAPLDFAEIEFYGNWEYQCPHCQRAANHILADDREGAR